MTEAARVALEKAYQRWEEPTRKWFDSLPLWVRLHPDLPEIWDQVIANKMIDSVGRIRSELEACLKGRDKMNEMLGRPPRPVTVSGLGSVFVDEPLRKWMLVYLAEISPSNLEAREAVEGLIHAIFPQGEPL